jgi:hypothetical protein
MKGRKERTITADGNDHLGMPLIKLKVTALQKLRQLLRSRD